MNAVQQEAMQVEPMKEPTKLTPDATQPAAVAIAKDNAKKMLKIITDGLGALRRGTYNGHDTLILAELEVFLKNVSNDLRQAAGLSGPQPAVKFNPQSTVPAPEAVQA